MKIVLCDQMVLQVSSWVYKNETYVICTPCPENQESTAGSWEIKKVVIKFGLVV